MAALSDGIAAEHKCNSPRRCNWLPFPMFPNCYYTAVMGLSLHLRTLSNIVPMSKELPELKPERCTYSIDACLQILCGSLHSFLVVFTNRFCPFPDHEICWQQQLAAGKPEPNLHPVPMPYLLLRSTHRLHVFTAFCRDMLLLMLLRTRIGAPPPSGKLEMAG